MADLTVLAAAAGKIIVDAIPAAFGALVSLRFLPAELKLTVRQRAIAAACAYGTGTYFGRGMAAYLNITNPHVVDMLVVAFALFGLTLAGTIIAEIKPILHAVMTKWFGAAPKDTDGGVQ